MPSRKGKQTTNSNSMKEHIINISSEAAEGLKLRPVYTTASLTLLSECAEGVRIVKGHRYYLAASPDYAGLSFCTEEAMAAAIATPKTPLEQYFRGEASTNAEETMEETMALIEEACTASEVACQFSLKRTSEGEGELALFIGDSKLGAMTCVTFDNGAFNEIESKQNPMDAEGGAA